METMVYVNGEQPALSSTVTVYACYTNEAGEIGVVNKAVQVPLRMLLKPCQPETTAGPFALTIKSAEPVLSFSQIFPGRWRLIKPPFSPFPRSFSHDVYTLDREGIV